MINAVTRVVQTLAFTMFAAMFVLTLAQVLFRYVLQIPVPWTEEAARALFVLATMSGIALAYQKREHIIVDVFYDSLSDKSRRVLSIIFAIAILAFLVLWARGAIGLIERNWTVRLITVSWFRGAYYYIWELAMIVLLGLYVLVDLRDLVTGRRTSLHTHEQESDL